MKLQRPVLESQSLLQEIVGFGQILPCFCCYKRIRVFKTCLGMVISFYKKLLTSDRFFSTLVKNGSK